MSQQLYTVGAGFDESRNTSRVVPVSPLAVDEALRACARLRRQAPRFVEWLLAGAPAVRSGAEHVERFGQAYKRGELS